MMTWTVRSATAVKPVSNQKECQGVSLPALQNLQFGRRRTLDVLVETVILQTVFVWLHMHDKSCGVLGFPCMTFELE